MSVQETSRSFSRRRVLATGASAGVASAILAACGATTNAPAAQKKGPVTIEVVTRAGVTSPTGHSQFYDKRAKQIFTPETNITVNWIEPASDSNAGEKLTIMATAGQLPDAAWFGVVADGFNGREQASKSIFKPLDDIAKKDSKFDLKPYFKAMLEALTVGGKLYALPTHTHYGTTVLYYNKNLTDAAGVKVPDDGSWTLDELLSAAQKLTKRSEDQWGFWPDRNFPEHGAFWMRSFGAEYLSADGKKLMIDTPEARQAFEFVHGTQYKAQVIDDLYRTVQGAPLNLGGTRGLFAMGKLAMHFTTPGLVAEYLKPGQEEVKFPVGIALMARGPKARGTQASGSGMGLVGTKNQEAAWEWLKFVTNKDNGVEQVFGGAGSPGGRTDVWNDAKLLKERGHIYQTIIKAYPQGAGSLNLAANNRYSFVTNAVNAEIEKFYRNQTSVADAITKAMQAGTAELTR